jgi:uncharacterized protein (TIGR00369 family)
MLDPGCVHIVLPGRPEVNQQHGCIHAGATSAIADSAGGYAAFTLFPENTSVLTVEYKINFLAPAVGDHIEAVGRVLKSGRTLTVCQLEVFAVQGTTRSLVAAGHSSASPTTCCASAPPFRRSATSAWYDRAPRRAGARRPNVDRGASSGACAEERYHQFKMT